MAPLRRLDAFFARFEHPWLVAVAGLGAAWVVLSFPVGALGPAVHPIFSLLGVVLHGLGLLALAASGVLFALLWWRGYIDERFFGG